MPCLLCRFSAGQRHANYDNAWSFLFLWILILSDDLELRLSLPYQSECVHLCLTDRLNFVRELLSAVGDGLFVVGLCLSFELYCSGNDEQGGLILNAALVVEYSKLASPSHQPYP